MSLVTPEQLAQYEAGDPQTFLNGVSAAVQRYCGWHIAPAQDDVLTLDSRGGRHLHLPSLKVVTVASVTVCGELTDPSEYSWSESGYIELHCGSFPHRPRSVVVDLHHGFAEIPADLMDVIMRVAARAKATPMGATRQAAGGVSFDFGRTSSGLAAGTALMADDYAILDLYKVPGVQ